MAAFLPDAVLADGFLGLSFYGDSPGVAHSVQTSAGLQNWTTSSVTLSPPDANGYRIGSVSAGAGDRFLRLVVSF